MHIVIMGCGRVGSTLAHILEDRDNTVAVIDRDPEAFRRLKSSFKGDRITGIGFDRAVLTQVAVTPDWIGEPVKVLEATAGARIAYIDRLGAAIVPLATTVLQEGDVVHVIALESDVHQIARTFAKRERGAH